MEWKIENSKLVYGIGKKDLAYLDINSEGQLELILGQGRISFEDILESVDKNTKYCNASFALRIPQLITKQIKKLIHSFKLAREEFHYKGAYEPIYPIKVNHSPFIIETIIKAHPTYGFESGTKSEFILIKEALKDEKHRLIMCNGGKDREFLKSINDAVKEGYKICISIESEQELIDALDILPREGYQLAFRIKPYVTLHGHWGASGSRNSKFGLAIGELNNVIKILQENKATHLLTTLHAHPGSQLTILDDFVEYASFMAKIYRLLYEKGMDNLKAIDFGGGMPIDYDNRLDEKFMEKYARIFVEVLSKELAKHQPIIMTESGRAITALSTIIIVKTIDKYTVFPDGYFDKEIMKSISKESDPFKDAKSASEVLKKWMAWEKRKRPFKNLQEFNDYEYITKQLKAFLREKFYSFEDFTKHLDDPLTTALLKPEYTIQGNFSVFNSICDLVLVKQYFPTIPINNLHIQPETIVRLLDITCDSDGEVAIYNAPISTKKLSTKDHFLLTYETPYSLGGFPVGIMDEFRDSYFVVPLTGAYQDIIEFDHNLLGDIPDILISFDGKEWHTALVNGAQTISSILADVGYIIEIKDDPYFDQDE
ncbi:MAG: hypothetical protein ACTSO7_18745 [Candidatus Heimdallarchaeota archaeon]